jgi:hypothetical protein
VKFAEKGSITYENGLQVGTVEVANTGFVVYLPLIRK